MSNFDVYIRFLWGWLGQNGIRSLFINGGDVLPESRGKLNSQLVLGVFREIYEANRSFSF